ncbi:PilN domain-containing protein [Patescibacteria group bacterium]|nr:PilN domain-containing protein [Patescibacteria group bacterium]MBU4512472.1 PilN domain-containing protein [Patescibacteria group bacterium]
MALENLAAIILITTIAAGILLLISKMVLQNNFYNSIVSSQIFLNKNRSLTLSIQGVNSKLKTLKNIQADFTKLSDSLIEFSKLVPQDIQLHLLYIDKVNSTINIEGNAQTREGLLGFQENLEDSSLFSKVEYPLSNLLEKQDIKFKFTAQLK